MAPVAQNLLWAQNQQTQALMWRGQDSPEYQAATGQVHRLRGILRDAGMLGSEDHQQDTATGITTLVELAQGRGINTNVANGD